MDRHIGNMVISVKKTTRLMDSKTYNKNKSDKENKNNNKNNKQQYSDSPTVSLNLLCYL